MEWNELSKEEQMKIYTETLEDISDCCDCWEYIFERVNGICPKCGRATVDGSCACGCHYSSTQCTCCGASPCDGSC